MTNEIFSSIGLMSGTSMDGVDVALVDTDGERLTSLGPLFFQAYDESDREILRAAVKAAPAIDDRTARPAPFLNAEALITARHREAVAQFMRQNRLEAGDIGVVGFHGQTVLHRPERGLTIQLGDGESLARQLNIPVVYDFRARDMEGGGQGAPLVPVFHQALVKGAKLAYPIIVLNIGGVANISYMESADGPLIACDVGPGGALLDDFMLERAGVAMDKDGKAAAAGVIDDCALQALLSHPFFKQPPPKSLDRNAFTREAVAALSTERGAATLTAFTARAAAHCLSFLPKRPRSLVVAGGGAQNPTLCARLTEAFGVKAVIADEIGWSGAGLEAQAFAFLAVRALKGLPITFPGTTGVARPLSGGVLARP